MTSTIRGPISPVDVGVNPRKIYLFRAHRVNAYRRHQEGKTRLTKWHCAYSIPYAALFNAVEMRTKALCHRNVLVSFDLPIKVAGLKKENLPQIREIFAGQRTGCRDCIREVEKQVFKRHLTELRELAPQWR